MKKRIISIMLVLCLAAVGAILSSCDTESENDTASSAAETATVTESPAIPTGQQPTEEPTEQPDEQVIESPTEPLDYKSLYISFLNSTDIEYDYGGLIYLNDDNIPELYLGTIPAAASSYICYIHDGKVESYKTYATSGLSYGERRGCFSTGSMHQGYVAWVIYYFDGEQVTEVHSGSSHNDEYSIDQTPVSKEEYEAVNNEYKCDSYPNSASSESELRKLIRDF